MRNHLKKVLAGRSLPSLKARIGADWINRVNMLKIMVLGLTLGLGAGLNAMEGNRQGDGGRTPLMSAAHNKNLEKVTFLIENGADVNATDVDGGTALMSAAGGIEEYQVGAQICKLLIENGANVAAQGRTRSTALHRAAVHCNLPVVLALLTTIPRSERNKILQTKATIVASQLAFQKTEPKFPKDVRKLVTQPLIDDLVNEQMGRAAALIAIQDWDKNIARDLATQTEWLNPIEAEEKGWIEESEEECPAVLQMLDLNNPATRATLRRQIKTNILRIFSEPEVAREECPICMGVQTSNRAPCCKQPVCRACWEQSLERTGQECPFCRRTHLPELD